MIESSTLPNEAVDYLNRIQQSQSSEVFSIDRGRARDELLNWAYNWFMTTQGWRRQSYEADWLRWQRNSDGRCDPEVSAKKKAWQSRVFVDITPSHRENIQAELFRLVAGSRPILDVTPRPGGDPAQAENIRDLQLRELEKSNFELVYNKILEAKTTYGSGFCRAWYETKYEDRLVRIPISEPIHDIAAVHRHMSGQAPIIGYKDTTQPRLIYRGVKLEHVPTWDFFWDPKAMEIKGHTCLFRSWMNLDYILEQTRLGNYHPEAAALMVESASNEMSPADRSQLNAERGIAETTPKREGNQKTWEGYELFGRLPQKWIYPLLKEPVPVEDSEKLVPARVIFNKQTVFAVELNDDYEGEPPFLKDDYFPVAERFMGRGIPEMLSNPQKVINAVVCQRLDEGDLALQQGYAVVEKALVNQEDMQAGGPGLVARFKQNQLGPNGDVRNVILPFPKHDIQTNAGFTEVHEWERMAMERTSANRVSLGSAGLLHDSNRTMGGMQILKQTAGEKFAFIAMLSEFSFLRNLFHTYWKLIYKNIQPQDVLAALGQERAAAFKLMSPEEVELGYKYEPKGIFEREAKGTRQARLAAMLQQFGQAPWFNALANFDEQVKSFDMDPEQLKIPQADAIQIMQKAQMMAEPMAKQMLTGIIMQTAVRDVERNLAEKMAEQRGDGPIGASDKDKDSGTRESPAVVPPGGPR